MRRLLAVLAVGGLALTACSSDGSGRDADAGAPTGAPAPAESPELPAQDLVDELLAPDVQPDPLATITGTVTTGQTAVPATVDVLEVRAGEESTLLRWRLRSSSAERVATFGSSMSRPGLQDTRGIVVQTDETVLQPFTYEGPGGTAFDAAGDLFCACSTLPTQVGPDGVLMYAVLPPLDSGTSTVDVLLPGFAPAEGVRVTS